MKIILYNIWHAFTGHPISDCYNNEVGEDKRIESIYCTKCKQRFYHSDFYL